jgi:uncharacterized protein
MIPRTLQRRITEQLLVGGKIVVIYGARQVGKTTLVRNVVIDNLKPLAERDDVGALWENMVIAERLKWLHYRQTLASLYFWRTYTGAEIDIVEERDGALYAYECKWGRPRGRAPESFLAAYPGASFETVTRDHYLAYLGAV